MSGVSIEVDPEKLDEDRRKTRRKMAVASFILLSIVGIGCIIFGLTSDVAAARVDRLINSLMVITGAWGGIIAGYLGVSMWEAKGRG